MLTPARLAVASLGCAAAAVGLGLAAAAASPGVVDEVVAARFAELGPASPGVVEVALVLQVLGSAPVVLPLVLVCSWLLLRAGWRAWAWWLAACAVGGWVLTQLLKLLVARDRPPHGLVEAAGWSFPSGHASAGLYGWAALGVVALVLLPRPWNRWLGVLAVSVGLLMGPSRWVLGVHWFSDVVGGWLVAGAWVLAVSAVTLRVVSGGGGSVRT